ncbi:MAG: hypothetical protein K2X47_04015, partial [Bdellovibrionales bacterium]|nr:hypothetical protein [Bdellovibrionales bacterium]
MPSIMRTHLGFLRAPFALCCILGLALGCTNVRLEKMKEPGVSPLSKGEFCTQEPTDIDRSVKFLFIMDKSGSNVSGGGFGGAGTDPNNLKRAGNFEAFYEENKANSNIHWGMIGFQEGGEGTRALIEVDGGPGFTNIDSEVRAGVARLRGNADDGGTPYRAALTTARSAIERDLQKHPEMSSTYWVFFISDGEPTDETNQNELDTLVSQLRSVAPNSIFLSTAYYGPTNPSGEARLRRMAEIGDGKYINFNNTAKLDFDDLIVKPTKEPWDIKDFMVYNLNANLCRDGKMEVDSDADGVCDRDELQFGLDPTKRFSPTDNFDAANPRTNPNNRKGTPRNQTQGFGDYFRLREIEFGERLDICSDKKDEDRDLLTTCEEAFLFNQNPVGTAGGRKSGDPKNPDTDLDGVIDGIEVYMLRDRSSALDGSNMDDVLDGEPEDVKTQIREHRNPRLRDPETFKYDTFVTALPDKLDGATCYDFNQKKLLLYPTLAVRQADALELQDHAAGENVVLVYFLQ